MPHLALLMTAAATTTAAAAAVAAEPVVVQEINLLLQLNYQQPGRTCEEGCLG